MEYTIIPYTPEYESSWDTFVQNTSANGTFLQTRRFLNYHPADRFEDASLIVHNSKGVIVAIVPAASVSRNGLKVFVSHPGSTYGGPVIHSAYTGAEKTISIVRSINDYVSSNYSRAEFKLTPSLLCARECCSLNYAFYYLGYSSWEELNTWTRTANDEVLFSELRQDKKHAYKKISKMGLVYKPLENLDDVAMFYHLLENNLQKYAVKPVHTLEELMDFKCSRLTNETVFYGLWDKENLVAGSMSFYFKQANILHTQYLSADLGITTYSPATALYCYTMLNAQNNHIQAISWGISTEDHGHFINMGLVTNKEGYGCNHSVNYTYYKDF